SNMRDTEYRSPFFIPPTYPNDGDDIYKAFDAAELVTPIPAERGVYPNGNGYTGEGVFWYDIEQGLPGISAFEQFTSNIQFKLPAVIHALAFDSGGRLLIGTEGGIWRGVSQRFKYDTTSGGSLSGRAIWSIEFDLGVNTPQEPGMILTDLNGNLQIPDQTSVA